MTEPDTPSTPEPLTPREEEVRRLLADARQTEPMPADVVTRLDRVLADLAEEPVREGAVVRLARRRRRTSTLLVAAAAVVAVGIGVNQVVGSGGSDDADDSSVTAAESEGEDEAGAAPESSSDGLAGGGDTQFDAAPSSPAERAGLRTLSKQDFGDDVRTTRRELSAFAANDGANLLNEKSYAMRADEAAGAACGSDAWGRGAFVPVRYGSTPAVLVFRPTRGNTQIADLFLCGSEQPVRSVTLPAP